jgi:hypothetical protein|tara:strand:+ start:1754 stop:1945 length:192 start_codon:yes stop_codon:yes gene_type:complete
MGVNIDTWNFIYNILILKLYLGFHLRKLGTKSKAPSKIIMSIIKTFFLISGHQFLKSFICLDS